METVVTKENPKAPQTVNEWRAAVRAAGERKTWVGSASIEACRAFLERGERPAGTARADLGALIADAARDAMAESADDIARAAVDAVIRERAAELRPVIQIVIGDRPPVSLPDGAHAALPTVCKRLACGLPVMLVGPTGSGKSTLARQAAHAFGRPFSFLSMSAGTTEAAVFGRVLPDESGAWRYRDSSFVRAWRDGGIHLFDEVDAADPNMLVKLNAALDCGLLATDHGDAPPIPRHPDAGILFAANTYGFGGDRMYVGRNALDAATLNRVSVSTIEVDYDRDLEMRIALATCGDSAEELLDWSWKTRDAIVTHKLRRTLSTRTIADSARLMSSGESLDAIRSAYFVNWSADDRARVN